ncbi:hypothetical protein CAL12_22070 [Bordetella genomosp. 8]|uniref:Type III secretion protein n=1 Tax=Bordetella genomosp. 8 TaxID=1416806 RepID=A0A1W6YQN4_9BORD|nr:YscO family type III secretion system apparatus protein [Bordetella genomosp. 8]ARP83239.1 hypothetical protein CAL12_22070 [Bordetella genomosp. 8]
MTTIARDLRHDLVVLRRLREDRAARALAPLYRQSEEAALHLARQKRQLDNWRIQAADEEAAMYAALLGEPVNRRELERRFAKIDALRQRTRALERAVEAAREARDQADAALAQGKAVRAAAARATRKSTEVLERYRRHRALEQERVADDALDEAAVTIHGRFAP